jgi:hypothetical protein
MRISADPDDPGYANYVAHRGSRVFLDGIERDGIFTADEERRFIIMAVRDERGNVKVKDDMVVREKWTGNVHIELSPPVAPSANIHMKFGVQAVPARIFRSSDDSAAQSGRDIAHAIQRAMRRNP